MTLDELITEINAACDQPGRAHDDPSGSNNSAAIVMLERFLNPSREVRPHRDMQAFDHGRAVHCPWAATVSANTGHTGPCCCMYAMAGFCSTKSGYVSISFMKMNGTR
jgi:hypothetical protein